MRTGRDEVSDEALGPSRHIAPGLAAGWAEVANGDFVVPGHLLRGSKRLTLNAAGPLFPQPSVILHFSSWGQHPLYLLHRLARAHEIRAEDGVEHHAFAAKPGSERLRLMTRKYARTHTRTHPLPSSLTHSHTDSLSPLPAPQAIKEIRSTWATPSALSLPALCPAIVRVLLSSVSPCRTTHNFSRGTVIPGDRHTTNYTPSRGPNRFLMATNEGTYRQ